MKKTICLFDGADLVRAGVKALIEKHRDFNVAEDVRTASSSRMTQLTKRAKPDVVVLLVSPAGSRGLMTRIRGIRAGHKEARIMLVCAPGDTRTVEIANRAQVDACVPLYVKEAALISALKRLARGQHMTRISAELQRRRRVADRGPIAVLTQREQEVVQSITGGNNTKQTAKLLGISPKTVEVHRLNLMKKLGLQSVADLTKLAIRGGLTSLEG